MIQTFLIIFNCVAFLASGGVLAFAIYALVGNGFTESLLPEGLPDSVAQLLFDNDGKSFQLPLLVLAAVSGLVLFVSFLGCVGSCQQSRCLVALYFVCLFSFLLALMAATAYCFIGDPQRPIIASMKLSMAHYKRDNLTSILWDKMQTQLKCCGTESIDDWKSIGWTSNCSAPWSCKVLEERKVSMILEKEEVVSEEKEEKEKTVTTSSENSVIREETTTQVNLAKKSKQKRTKDNVVEGKTRRKRGLNDTLVNGESMEELSEKNFDKECLNDFSVPHYNEGCLLKLQEVMQSYITIVGAIIVSIWAVVIVNVLFSFALCVVLDYAEYTYK